MVDIPLLWDDALAAAATFLINSNTGNETGFSGLVSGAAVTSSVSGTAGVFSPSTWGYGPWGLIEMNFGGTVAVGAAALIQGWFLRSIDGGTTFETPVTTPSTTVPALERAPDFILPCSNLSYVSGNRVGAMGLILIPPVPFKVLVQNRLVATLPSSTTNWIKMVAANLRGA